MNIRVRRKGVMLIVTVMVMTVLMILTGAYFISLQSEKQSSDSEKAVMQALGLAEAGAGHARAELRRRIRSDLNVRVGNITTSSTFQAYVTANDSLGFLRDYAYLPGNAQFTVINGTAILSIPSMAAVFSNTTFAGNYSGQISVQPFAAPLNPSGEVYQFKYRYWLDATGQAQGFTPAARQVRLAGGLFNVTVRRDTFSKYALFTFHHRTQSGTVVWFTGSTNFTGPVHTNERFSFANNPSAYFTEDVTQHNQTARFNNNNNNILLDNSSNPPRDVPVFDTTFTRGVDMITMNTSVTQSAVKAQALGTLSEPGTNGIYIPNDGTSVTGGFYIRGNCIISAAVGSGNSAVYNITQGAATKRITVDYANNQTIVYNGTNVTYAGLPTGTGHEGVIIYAKDNITGFSGTVQRSSAVTVTTERDMIISNNVQYEQFNAGPPSNATGYSNILSMLSWNGDVRVGTAAPNNVTIHGVIMAPNGVFTVDDYDQGAPRGIATLMGGVITDYYGAFGQFSGTNMTHGYGRNFVYDARMLNGMTPPYFPYMNTFTSNVGQDGNGTEDLNREMTWREI